MAWSVTDLSEVLKFVGVGDSEVSAREISLRRSKYIGYAEMKKVYSRFIFLFKKSVHK